MATDVSAPFPDVDLEEQSIITVALNDPLAKITRVVVHFTQDIPDLQTKVQLLPPLYVNEASRMAGGN